MKLVKSLLLGSAATLAAAAGAQAADLPFRKAAPVEYVRVCDWTGAGFFYIPGTDTCIKIAGAIRAEYAFVEPTKSFSPNAFNTALAGARPAAGGLFIPGRARSATGFFARGHIDIDARSQTAYGQLRGFVRLQDDVKGGNYNAGAGNNGTNVSSAYIDKAYITFAGITAGRVQSFFDLYADNYNYEGIANSDESTQVLAYTATFGGGFSATLSAEDPTSGRRDGIGTIAFGNTAIGVQSFAFTGQQAQYAGVRFPDAVIQLRYDQAWGAIQLSGAYHDINTAANPITLANGFATNFAKKDDSGFAVQAGIDVKLPMLAAGDELFLQGAYQEGAYLYQDSGSNLNSGFYGSNIGGFQHNDVDAVAVGIPGTAGYTLQKGKGFSVMGALHHYFTPQFHDVLFGSYEEIGYGNIVKNISWTRGGIGDGSEYRIGNQFIFTPVHNLDIGLEVMYSKINQTLAHEVGAAGVAAARAAFATTGVALNPDSFQARLRLERDF